MNEDGIATDLPDSASKADGVTDEETTQAQEEETDQAPSESSPESARPASELRPDYTVVRLIEKADRSAGKLVNLLAKHFECFRDETRFDGKKVRLLKRAQIFVADLWAAFGGKGYGEFHDIDHITMFAGKVKMQLTTSRGFKTDALLQTTECRRCSTHSTF